METTVKQRLGLAVGVAALLIVTFAPKINAQDKKEVKREILINNGDTLVNGKKLSEADKTERERLRKELHSIEKSKPVGQKDVLIKRDKPIPGLDEGEMSIMELNLNDAPFEKHVFRFEHDSLRLGTDSLFKDLKFDDKRPLRFERRFIARDGDMESHDRLIFRGEAGDFLTDRPTDVFIKRHPENTQVFNYLNTDKDGISTRTSFRVHDAEEEKINKLSRSGKADIDLIQDLTIYPNLSSGKTTISFSLVAKNTAEVKVLDNNLKTVFTDKASSGSFSKQINLPKNGIYYLSVSQNKKWLVKQIVKE